MLVIKSVAEVRETIAKQRRLGKKIGVVPTMGALHQGHLSLVHAIRPHCDYIVMWDFLNPVQFNSKADYDGYPVNLPRDIELAGGAGVDLLFVPSVAEIYPRGMETYDEEECCRVYAGKRALGFCGSYRPGHFDGVVHVVAIFFNILKPDVAVFGEKDYQQVQVIKELVSDLHYDVEIVTAPIIREESGLAMSSRNELLGSKQAGALAISGALFDAARMVSEGKVAASEVEKAVRDAITSAGLRVEYAEVVDAETLEKVEKIEEEAQLLVAAYCDSVRLIDNMRLITRHREAGE